MGEFVMHPLWNEALGQLKRSIYAQQVFCSVITEMRRLEPFSGNTFSQIYKLSFETSFYRNNACGHIIRLHYTRQVEEVEACRVALMVVECIYQAKHFDRQISYLLEQHDAEGMDEDVKKWVGLSVLWHRESINWLSQSAKTVKTLMPKEIWVAGKESARSTLENA